MHLHLSIQLLLEPLLDVMFQEYGNIFVDFLCKVKAEMEPVTMDSKQCTNDKRYLYYEHGTLLPRECSPSMMKWSDPIVGYPGAKESPLDFNKWFYTTMNAKETLELMQAITDACQGKASKHCDVIDPELYISLPIPCCTSRTFKSSPRRSWWLQQRTCGDMRLDQIQPGISLEYQVHQRGHGQDTSGHHVQRLLCLHKEMISTKDLLVQCATRWYKRVLTALNVGFHTVDTLYSKQQPCTLPPMHEERSEDGEGPRLGEPDHENLKKFQMWIQPP